MSKPEPGAHDQRTHVQGPGEAARPEFAFQESPTLAEGGAAAPGMQPIPLSRLDEYELLMEVGRGGMGVVFKARHVRLGRIVALKMILGGALARTDDLQRFETEAAAAAQLQHPNIVALYEVGAHQNQPYFCMEFISGSSLAERVALGPVPGRRAAGYLEAVARAVHYAHTRGILHRDLKPANVLLDEHDQPKVADFGLAKLLSTDSGQTRTGAVLGTPSYMSPEQAAGRKDIGTASDVYSLGAILYELLTGKPPFTGETQLATLNQVAEREPTAPRALNPLVDLDLETICLKCLDKDPARRYASAEALATDLRNFLDGDPISARPLGKLRRLARWCRRYPAGAALIAVASLGLVGFVLFEWQTAREERALREEAEAAQRLAQVRFDTMRHLLYLAEIRQAQQALVHADFDQVERLLGHWEPREGLRDLRDWEWFFLKRQGQGRFALGRHQGRATAVAYHPSGKQLASAGGELGKAGEVHLWNVKSGGTARTLKGHADLVTAVAYHPHKNWLASASYDKTVRVWDLDKGEAILLLQGHAAHVAGVAFAPDGQWLASAGGDHTVRLWNLNEAQPAGQILRGHDGEVSSVAFHPDGRRLASGSHDRTIRIWDALSGSLEQTLNGHAGEVDCLAFSNDGKLLASGGGQGNRRGELYLWDVETGAVQGSRSRLSQRVLGVAFSRDGQLAAATSDGLIRLWEDGLRSEALALRGDTQLVYGLAFSPNGTTLVSAGLSGRVSVWNSSGGLESLSLPVPGTVSSLAFNPVGRFLAAASTRAEGDVPVWNLDYPERAIHTKGHVGSVLSVAFAADGNLLASGGEDRTVRLVDLRHPDQPATVLAGHEGPVSALALGPDGTLLAAGSSAESAIRLWDPQRSAAPVRVLDGQTNGVQALAFSRDGNWLAVAGYDKTVRVWDLREEGKSLTLTGHDGWVNTLAFSPDGTQLATGSNDRTIAVWDLPSAKVALRLEGAPTPVLSLAWHPDGRRLVSVGADKIIRLWDVVTKQEILELEDPFGAIRMVAFSADGRYLAGGGTNVVRVWEAESKRER